MKLVKIGIAFLLCVLGWGALLGFSGHALASVSIGQRAPDFSIPDALTGDNVALSDQYGAHKAVVLLFIGVKCPISNSYDLRMEDLFNKYSELGVSVMGINSNDDEEEAAIVEHRWVNHLTFPILKDDHNVVADTYGAMHTPEAFVVDQNGILVYHGRIDNSAELKNVTTHELTDAIDAVLSGKPVTVPETKAFGCKITRFTAQ
jgi:peroxiredoxin